METKGRLIAGSHNRNEFVLINEDEIGRVCEIPITWRYSVIRYKPLAIKVCQWPSFAIAGIQCYSTVISLYKKMCAQHNYQGNGGGDSNQPRMDAVNNGTSFIGVERSNLDITCSEEGRIIMQERKKGKSGVKIEIPLEKVLQYSGLKRDDAAKKLEVSSSTLKRVCRQYGIGRWPPCNIDNVGAPQPLHDVPPRNLDKVGASQPLCVKLEKGILELNSDRPSH